MAVFKQSVQELSSAFGAKMLGPPLVFYEERKGSMGESEIRCTIVIVLRFEPIIQEPKQYNGEIEFSIFYQRIKTKNLLHEETRPKIERIALEPAPLKEERDQLFSLAKEKVSLLIERLSEQLTSLAVSTQGGFMEN